MLFVTNRWNLFRALILLVSNVHFWGQSIVANARWQQTYIITAFISSAYSLKVKTLLQKMQQKAQTQDVSMYVKKNKNGSQVFTTELCKQWSYTWSICCNTKSSIIATRITGQDMMYQNNVSTLDQNQSPSLRMMTPRLLLIMDFLQAQTVSSIWKKTSTHPILANSVWWKRGHISVVLLFKIKTLTKHLHVKYFSSCFSFPYTCLMIGSKCLPSN